jgi:hypothetical protein
LIKAKREVMFAALPLTHGAHGRLMQFGHRVPSGGKLATTDVTKS